MSDSTNGQHREPRTEAGGSIALLENSGTSYAAIVALRGEHDLSTAVEIQDTLQLLYGNVLVDFSDCGFIDSTVISVLIRDHQSRLREGQRLELRVPGANSTITRTLTISGVGEMLIVHTSQDGSAPAVSA